MARTAPFLLRPENQKFIAGETRRLTGTPGLVHFSIPLVLTLPAPESPVVILYHSDTVYQLL
jgi:hypothetical protein